MWSTRRYNRQGAEQRSEIHQLLLPGVLYLCFLLVCVAAITS